MKLLYFFSLALLTLTGATQQSLAEQLITFQNTTSPAPYLICPTKKPTASKKTQPTVTDTVNELPSQDELLQLLSSQPIDPGNNTKLLELTPLKKPVDRPYRIGLWGDSHTAAGFFTEEMIQSMQLNKEDVQTSFIPPSIGRGGVRLPLRKTCSGGGWRFTHAYNSEPSTNFYPGLIRLHAENVNSYLWLDFRNQGQSTSLQSLRVLIDRHSTPVKTLLGVSVDDQAEKIIEILPNSDPQIQINAQNPISTIKLRLVSGTIVLNGFIPSYSSPAKLILDTMAIPSATMKPWAFIDPLIFSSIQKDPYDLVIFAYGTNEGAQPNWNATQYGDDLRAALVGMRKAYPEAACVLIGPTDRGLYNQKARKQKKGVNPAKYDMLKYSKIHHQITQIQQTIGQEYACISWSWQAAMGGMGGAYQWLYTSPPLMSRDLTHLTISGYQKSAQEFIKSLQLQSLFNN